MSSGGGRLSVVSLPLCVGPVDLVATAYGVRLQNATAIALTKLDVLSYMQKLPVVTAYELDGKLTQSFPFPSALSAAKPHVEYLDGWGCDISAVRTWDELPENAKRYVEYIEKAVGCKIKYVSVGAERDACIVR